MDSSKIEKSHVLLRHILKISVITVIISAACYMCVTNHSNIRNVDILAISGFGATIGVFIVNLVLFIKTKNKKMDSSKIEISPVRVRRILMISVVAVIISAACCMNVTKHSNIRNGDIIAISGFGAFIVNLVILIVKKQRDFTRTGY